jgi:putative cell wall-binding protein
MRRLAVFATVLVTLGLLSVAPTDALTGPAPTNPVRTRSYPDPFVLPVDGTYYAYATDGDLGEVQLIKSTDLVRWTEVGDALSSAPAWGQDDDVWGPAVTRLGTSSYVLYASFVNEDTGKRCVGAATSTTPTGPFKAVDSFKLCDDARGGVIDPSVYNASGTRYLLWKTEGVVGSNAEPPSVFSQALSTNGLSRTGSSARIFRSEQPWEGTLVENPSMVADGTRTYLFYSGNEWESASYKIGWAACAGPLGPCIAPVNKPLMESEAPHVFGPGGGAVFRDDVGYWMALAAWNDQTHVSEDSGGQRALVLRRLQFPGGRPQLTGPDGQFREPAFTQRIAGTDRYGTAAAFSAQTVQVSRPVTYVATGATYADALIASAASGFEDSPVLLVTQDSIPAAAKAELARVNPGHIVVMGDTSAISPSVYDQLSSYSHGSIHREAGVNVYHLSALVSRNTFDPGEGVVYVATGEKFPDGLAGGAAGAANHGPLLLVQQNAIPVDVKTELDRLNPQRIVVLGGTGVISDAVLNGLRAYSSNVTRVAGNDRYETAAQLATSQFTKVHGSVAAVVIATGQNFPDAVAAGAAGYPVLLVPTNGQASAATRFALAALNPLGVIVMGGTSAVSQATLASLNL